MLIALATIPPIAIKPISFLFSNWRRFPKRFLGSASISNGFAMMSGILAKL